MIICQCNIISESEIEKAVIRLLEEDPWQLIVPMQVYHALGRRGRCCSCFPNVVDIIARVTEDYHRRHMPSNADPAVQGALAQQRPRRIRTGRRRRARRARLGTSAA